MGAVTSSSMAWLLLLAAGLNSCIGNLMLKQSRLAAPDGTFSNLILSPWFWGGLVFYGINVVFFVKALEKIPVSIAYPVLAGTGFSMLVFAAHWMFDERLTANQYVGLVAIVIGIVFLGRS